MTMNLRADDTFVEDGGWHLASERYSEFLRRHKHTRILFLELGVGYNTPGITADHLLTVQVQWNARTRNLRTGDEFSLLHSRYRIVSLVGTELDLRQERGILNLMARKAAGEEAP